MKMLNVILSTTLVVLLTISSTQAQTVEDRLAWLEQRVWELQTQVDAQHCPTLEEFGQFVTIDWNPINGVPGPHLIFTGVNVHVRSGSGSTVDTSNLGNVIIGYNEPRPQGDESNRWGSHTVVIGPWHQFIGSGGLVAGLGNAVRADHATVSAGEANIAWVLASGVSGGSGNWAVGTHSTVSGGTNNQAIRAYSTVSGGRRNFANGVASSVSGGSENVANGEEASVSGGSFNSADATNSSVTGGSRNSAQGVSSSVSGGFGRGTNSDFEWCAGSLCEPL